MVKTALSSLVAVVFAMAISVPAVSANRAAFLELSADKAEVYVQEQLILTVQLYFSGSLIQGDLSEPTHPDAIIERLGNQQESTQYRDGIRYKLIERRYAIFPQEPGTLTLPGIRFEGHIRDASRQLRSVQDTQQLYDVPVKSIPDTYPVNTAWLPARNLSLSEEGLPQTDELEAGSNLTRKLTLQANGLPAEALPPFPQQLSGRIRQYPDQPLRNTDTTINGLQSVLQQSFALVPVQAGAAVVPALSIPWWNTETDQLERAVLPARRYQITGSEAVGAEPVTNQTPTTPDTDTGADASEEEKQGVSVWVLGTFLFAALWLVTLTLWWRTRTGKAGKSHNTGEQPEPTGKQAFEELTRAVKNGSAQTSGLLLRWARYRYPGQSFATARDAIRYLEDDELEEAMRAFQEDLFSAQRDSSAVKEEHRVRLLKAIRAMPEETETAGSQRLPPLYPAGLSE